MAGTTAPGLQLYTADHFDGRPSRRTGSAYADDRETAPTGGANPHSAFTMGSVTCPSATEGG
ncbi:hypothetical protein RI138_08440 [Streptomyces sp. C11-1]|uniref:Uncharacterized protein n=1 Tax=Streptomyces durocortorensis TaxID=2811104 RepID=A0ABY9VUP7_9ACTN|nr:hypothetical protein [Streptomyces durocortorensis]WNF26864.1 hypothetical protein RI138_08440 [Streptomyces durocortorensis]